MLINSLLYNLRIAPVERICYTHFEIGMRIAYPLMKRIRLLRQQLFNTFYFFTLKVTTSLTCLFKETKKAMLIIGVTAVITSLPFLIIIISITGSFIAYLEYL